MINFLLDFVLIAGMDSFIILLFLLGNKYKTLAKSKLFLAWLLLTVFLKVLKLVLLGIPAISQVLILLFSSFIIYKLFNVDFKECVLKYIILFFVIMLPIEAVFYFYVLNFIGVDAYVTYDAIQKIRITSTTRLTEILVVILYLKGVFRMGYIWFMGKEEAKENEEVEVEGEETEE